MARPLVSVVIPVLNEATSIARSLQCIQDWRPSAEIIVVDGGSEDGSAALARPHCDHLLVTPRGRARQMNAGAEIASGNYLFFMHCDTQPRFSLQALQRLLAGAPLWGYFKVRLSGSAWQLRVVEWLMNLRSRLSRVATGDQLLFVRRKHFLTMKGYAPIPLMEDIELCKRLRAQSAPCASRLVVVTSSRRWDEQGMWNTILTMWRLRLAYWLGVSPRRLRKIYYG